MVLGNLDMSRHSVLESEASAESQQAGAPFKMYVEYL